MEHNHVTRDIKPLGECPACDKTRDVLTLEQAIELQKRQTRINKLEEAISYALAQKDLKYGMVGEDVFQFRMRKVFSILKEALEE